MHHHTVFKRPARALPPSLLALSAALLSACGGGGGGDAGAPVMPAALALDGSNYITAAQVAVSAGAYLVDSSRLVVAAQTGSSGASTRAAMAQLDRVAGRVARAPKLVTGAVSSFTEACSGGGTVSFSFSDQNGNGSIDAGDSMSLSFAACVEDGSTVNGGLDIAFSALTGVFASNSYSATISLVLKSLSASDATGTETGNGQMSLRVTAAGVYNETVTVEVPSLSTSGTLGGVAVSSAISGFALTLSQRPAGNGYSESISISGTLGGSSLGGKSIAVSTPTPIVRDWNALLPRAGLVMVRGAAGSQVRATVQANGTVLIELDADGNGTYETSATRSWAQLGG